MSNENHENHLLFRWLAMFVEEPRSRVTEGLLKRGSFRGFPAECVEEGPKEWLMRRRPGKI